MKPIWPELSSVIRASPALVLPGRYFIAEVGDVPDGIPTMMIFKDEVETTIIVETAFLKQIRVVRSRGPYIAIRLQLAQPFITPGLLASAASAIAEMRVTQIVYSSYSFDYIMVEEDNISSALSGLEMLGFPIVNGPGPEDLTPGS